MGFIGDIFGGKGGGSAPPPMPAMPAAPAIDMGAIAGMMEGLMGGMMGMQGMMMESQMQQMQEMQGMAPQMPEAIRAPVIDWTEKQAQLASKMKADYNIDQTRRKGRTGTVLSSPLLDDEEAITTGSVLSDISQTGTQ